MIRFNPLRAAAFSGITLALFLSSHAWADSLGSDNALPAFPGAEGAGKDARGGRGGDVYHVTNLRDAGPGSLRFGIERAAGPRTIVFDVAGTIDLASPIKIDKPNITVAGQTAPGGGIALKGYNLAIVGTHDVIVRYLRSRPGDIHTAPNVYEPDALSVVECKDIVIDHVSASWSTDEVLSTARRSNRVTVQWCIISEALHHSHHHKDNHGYGSLINGGDFTFHHNLYAHNRSRNPRPSQDADVTVPTRLDFVNNVIYNPGGRYGYSNQDTLFLNFVNNYGISGPNTTYDKLFHAAAATTKIHQRGNVMDVDKDGVLGGRQSGWSDFDGVFERSDERCDLPRTAVESAAKALNSVLTGAGASLYRDAIDARVVAEVRSYGAKGRHLDSQSQVGGWPDLPGGETLVDSDQDGMPDVYEKRIAYLNPADPQDRNRDGNKNGYTDLEDYLHFLTVQRTAQPTGE